MNSPSRTKLAQEKACKRCDSVKALAEFNRNRSAKDGLQKFCRSCQLVANRECRERKPEQYRESQRPRNARWRVRHGKSQAITPPKRLAWHAVERALQSGTLTRPDACEACSINTDLHAHHPDYDYPLDVIWLCPRCHHRLHAGLIECPSREGKS